MKEILVGFIFMGITVLGMHVCNEYEKIGDFVLGTIKVLLLIGVAYYLGAVALGTI